jgi:hypothetical protein
MSGIVSGIYEDVQAVSDFNNAFASYNQDVTGVFDANFNQLFADARPITAKVTPTAKLMEHPLETGATITDHRIINPIEIELNVILEPADYVDAYNEVKAVFYGTNSVTVQTIADVYPNMYIEQMPYDHTSQVIDTITMIIKLKEAQVVAQSTVQTVTVKNPADSATVTTGSQNGTTQTAPVGNTPTTGSAAYDWVYGSKN